MEKQTILEMFNKFSKLYKEKKIKLIFFKDAYSISIKADEIITINEEEKEAFNEFCSNFTNCLKEKIVDKEINEEYDELVEKFIKDNKYIRSEIITKTTSNLNTVFSIDHEILTKRDKELEENSLSVAVNLNFKRPVYRDSSFEQINFELSLKDLHDLQNEINTIFNDIDKLSKR